MSLEDRLSLMSIEDDASWMSVSSESDEEGDTSFQRNGDSRDIRESDMSGLHSITNDSRSSSSRHHRQINRSTSSTSSPRQSFRNRLYSVDTDIDDEEFAKYALSAESTAVTPPPTLTPNTNSRVLYNKNSTMSINSIAPEYTDVVLPAVMSTITPSTSSKSSQKKKSASVSPTQTQRKQNGVRSATSVAVEDEKPPAIEKKETSSSGRSIIRSLSASFRGNSGLYVRKPLRRIQELNTYINAVCIVPTTNTSQCRVVCASADSTVRLIDVLSGRIERIFEGHTDRVLAVAVSDAGVGNQLLVAGSRDECVCVWDLDSGALKHVMIGHEGPIWSIGIFARDNVRCIVSASGDFSLRTWNADTGKQVHLLKGHTDKVLAVVVFVDPKSQAPKIISGGGDNTVRIWDMLSGRHSRMLEGHRDEVHTVSVVSDTVSGGAEGPKIISAGRDKIIRIWDYGSGAVLKEITGSTDCIYGVQGIYVPSIMISSDKGLQEVGGPLFCLLVISCGEDRLLRIWNSELPTGKQLLHSLTYHTGSIKGLHVASVLENQILLASCSWDKTICFRDLELILTGKEEVGQGCCVVS